MKYLLLPVVMVGIGSTKDGNGAISTYSPGEKVLVGIGTNEGGNGMISTHSPGGKVLVRIGTNEGGGGMISTNDSGGKELIHITAYKDTGEGSIAAYNRAGNVRAVWPLK